MKLNPTTDTLLNALIRIQYYVIFRLRKYISVIVVLLNISVIAISSNMTVYEI